MAVNHTIRTDLGAVSAYAIAVEEGFQGTKAEWESYIANAAINAQNAATSASQASASATAAGQSETNASQSATNAQTAASHYPYIGDNGNWWVWDVNEGIFVDTNRPARGPAQDISGKADKVANATSGNFAALDNNGNITDSGAKPSDFLTQHQDLSAYATKQYVDQNFAAADAMVFKGTIGTGGTITTLPATHKKGWTYKVIEAGTYAGTVCEIGDLICCIEDGTQADNSHWVIAQGNTDGTVVGPASSTNENVVLFDGTTGKLIKDSGVNLNSKADVSAMNSALALKADTSTVNSALALKANISDVNTSLGTKADKVTGAVNGNFAGLDSNGNITDSGKKASDFLTTHQDISGKQNKITVTGILKGDGDGGVTAATAGTDYGTYSKPVSGIPSSDLASGVLTSIIDDTAGNGDTNKVWSANKAHDEVETLDNAIAISSSQPSATGNKIWINDDAMQEYTVPLYSEHEALTSAITDMGLSVVNGKLSITYEEESA